MSDRWYTPENARQLADACILSDESAEDFYCRHLNLAFAKGRQIGTGEMLLEIEFVLLLMDGLAEQPGLTGQWGDGGVFQRCRDRLRKLVVVQRCRETLRKLMEGRCDIETENAT